MINLCPKCNSEIDDKTADEASMKLLFSDSRIFRGGRCDVCGNENNELIPK